jgi:hypothetical protein
VTFPRIVGTALVLCGALLVFYFGFHALSVLNHECNSTLPVGACRALRLVLSSLLAFFAFYFAMVLTNKIWGRNLFKGKPG